MFAYGRSALNANKLFKYTFLEGHDLFGKLFPKYISILANAKYSETNKDIVFD